MKIKTKINEGQSLFQCIQNYDQKLYQLLMDTRSVIVGRIEKDHEQGKLTNEELDNMISHAYSTGADSFLCEIKNVVENGNDVEFELIVK